LEIGNDLFYFAYTDKMFFYINCREVGFREILFYNQKEAVKQIKDRLILEIGVRISRGFQRCGIPLF